MGTTQQRIVRIAGCSATGGNDRSPRQCLQSGPRSTDNLTGVVVRFSRRAFKKALFVTTGDTAPRYHTALNGVKPSLPPFDTVRW